MSQRLARKSMIVTGADSGIGRAIAQVFAAEGAFFTVKACWAKMKEQNYGRIVLTSSTTGPITEPSKGASGALSPSRFLQERRD